MPDMTLLLKVLVGDIVGAINENTKAIKEVSARMEAKDKQDMHDTALRAQMMRLKAMGAETTKRCRIPMTNERFPEMCGLATGHDGPCNAISDCKSWG